MEVCRVLSRAQTNGKVAAFVGGASGMARSTAEMLAAKGAKVAICDLPPSAGADVAKEIGNGTTFHDIDVTDFEGSEAVLDAVVQEPGELHVLVNTAGGGVAQRHLRHDGPAPLAPTRNDPH